ncbi:hypothetical protein GCM10028807_00330 [Spirosoma daeguense]
MLGLLTAGAGAGLVVTLVEAEPLQSPIVQVAVYVVVIVGVTVRVRPVAPSLQATVPPVQPDTDKAELPPGQMDGLVLFTVIDGLVQDGISSNSK